VSSWKQCVTTTNNSLQSVTKSIWLRHSHRWRKGHVTSKLPGIWDISFQSGKIDVIITSLIVQRPRGDWVNRRTANQECALNFMSRPDVPRHVSRLIIPSRDEWSNVRIAPRFGDRMLIWLMNKRLAIYFSCNAKFQVFFFSIKCKMRL